MLAQIDGKLVIGALSGCYIAIIGVIYWVSNNKVSNHFCGKMNEANNRSHQEMRDWIAAAEERSETRHKELREDIKDVKTLIKDSGCDRPRVQT